jgi:tetratricopeptide (TPR) repeat protein
LPALLAVVGLYGQGGGSLPDSLKFVESYAPELRPAVYYTEGVARATEEKPAEALDWFALALALNPQHAPSLYETANALVALGDVTKALEYSRLAVDLEPSNEWYRDQKVRLLVATGQFEEAAELTREHLVTNPYNQDNRLFLAQLYALTGQDSLRVVALEEVLAVDPDNVEALSGLSDSYFAQNAYTQFFATVQRLFLLDEVPLSGKIDYFARLLANWHFAEAHLSEMNELGRVLVSRYPAEIDLYLLKSWAEQRRGDWQGAHEALNQALAVATTDQQKSNILGTIGTLWHEQGNLPRSLKAYKKALALDPNNAGVLNNYAYYLAEKGVRLAHAFEMSSRAIALVENSATYLDTYAWVLYKLGRYTEARAVMKRALPLDGGGNSELLLHYGDILWALGEQFLASDYWKRAAKAGWNEAEITQRLSQIK